MAKDIFEKVFNFSRWDDIKSAKADGSMPYYRLVESPASPIARMEGKAKLMFGSNNYLGLTTDRRVIEDSIKAIKKYGPALTGARLQNGTIPLHLELESEIATWLGTDSALVYTTGYQANLGCISALCGQGDVLIVDASNHASIMDGAYLSQARVLPFRHGRIDKLEQLLQNLSTGSAAIMIAVDGTFSMEGTVSDISSIAELSTAYGCRLLVDDAHGIGVLGENGAGIVEVFKATKQTDLIMGTFSKSLASCGGFIAGSEDAIEFLRYSSRPFLFTASSVPAATAAALAAVKICKSEEGKKLFAKIRENAFYLHHELKSIGLPVIDHSTYIIDSNKETITTPIISIEIGSEDNTVEFWKNLYQMGLYVNAAVYPAVPPKRSLLRASVMATHEKEHLDRAIDIFAKVWSKLSNNILKSKKDS